MERQGRRGAVGGAAVRNLRSHRHLLPHHEGRRVQWTLSTGAHTQSLNIQTPLNITGLPPPRRRPLP